MTKEEQRPETPTTVVNLFGVALGEAEINLLSKGLSFCPIPCHMKKEEILDDLEKFFRRLRVKEFFQEEEEEETDADKLFHPLVFMDASQEERCCAGNVHQKD